MAMAARISSALRQSGLPREQLTQIAPRGRLRRKNAQRFPIGRRRFVEPV
jgi:hypothetical protein